MYKAGILVCFLTLSFLIAGVASNSAFAQDSNDIAIPVPPAAAVDDIDVASDIGFETPEPSQIITKKMANNFYEGCLDTPYYGLKKSYRTDFCSCASAALMAFMKKDEYNLLAKSKKNDPEYIPAYNKLLGKVYMPCVADPFFEMQKLACLKDNAGKYIRAKEKVPDDIMDLCNCTGNYIRKYIDEFGASDVISMNTYNLKEKDPFVILFNHPMISKQKLRSYKYCKLEMRKRLIQKKLEEEQKEKRKK